MIVRNTFFAEFCLLSVLLIVIRLERVYSVENSSCKNDNDICQPLSQCQWYKTSPNKALNTLKWCNISEYVVCCPQTTLTKTGPPYYNTTRPFTEDCKKWQKEVYPTCSPEGLIVGGRKAEPKEFPHMALLGVKKNKFYNWVCGGSLLSQRYVLTAAHCMEVKPEDIPNRARLGELDYSRDDDDALVQEFVIKDYTAHPGYDPEENYNDIAIIELDGIAQINSYVVPICLPVSSGSENERLHTAGWGTIGSAYEKSPYLQKVTLERFDETTCEAKIGKPLNLPNGIESAYQICAGSFTDKRDTCQGDSGGPLFIEHPDLRCMYLVHGITSFGYICGQENIPGIYTRVYPYIDWIESIVWKTNSPKN